MRTVHPNDRAHTCKICQKTFVALNDLADHMHTHSNKKLSCPKCDQLFTLERQVCAGLQNILLQLQYIFNILHEFLSYFPTLKCLLFFFSVQSNVTVVHCTHKQIKIRI